MLGVEREAVRHELVHVEVETGTNCGFGAGVGIEKADCGFFTGGKAVFESDSHRVTDSPHGVGLASPRAVVHDDPDDEEGGETDEGEEGEGYVGEV